MKLTTWRLFKEERFLAISGPTFDDLPPFSWAKADFAKECSHVGQPEEWRFGPVVHQWRLPTFRD